LKKNIYKTLFFLLYFSTQSYAQLCTGSLGDPVVQLDFGSGTSIHGSALGSGITSYNWTTADFPNDGSYTIESTTNTPGTWWTTTDHTGGGYMMVVNASFSITDYFYKNTVTDLCPDTTYEFAAWIMNLLKSRDNSTPNITFTIEATDGTILGTYNTGDIPLSSSPVWKQYGFYFTTPPNVSTVVIRMRNNKVGAAPGNDIALDDITFRPCGPTVSVSVQNETDLNFVVCQNQTISYTLGANISSGYNDPAYQWQLSNDNGVTWSDILGETSTTFSFNTSSVSGTYLYRIGVAQSENINSTNCRIASNTISIEVLETPEALTGETNQSFCTTQKPTISNLIVSTNAVWYDSPTGGNLLPYSTGLVDGYTYYASQETTNGCISDDRLGISVSIVSPSIPVFDVSDIVCDDLNDDVEIINLTNYETEITTCTDCTFSYFTTSTGAENLLESDQISNPSNYSWSSSVGTIYVRIDSSDQCYQTVELNITLQKSPIISIPDNIGLCENTSTVIDAGSGFDSYLWSTSEVTQSITVSNEGSYWVTVTKDKSGIICSSTKDFLVALSNVATISNIEVSDWTDTDNVIVVNLSSSSLGDYEYSLDGINYQDSNTFSGLKSGDYTVYVRDKNGCGIVTQEAFILNYPKYFTPNGDGNHDTWSVKFSETEPTLVTKIFDRYGKFIKQLNASSSWDGTYNGYDLPSSDYWFVVSRADGKIYKGHFAMKR